MLPNPTGSVDWAAVEAVEAQARREWNATDEVNVTLCYPTPSRRQVATVRTGPALRRRLKLLVSRGTPFATVRTRGGVEVRVF
jgi:hypothetical protein